MERRNIQTSSGPIPALIVSPADCGAAARKGPPRLVIVFHGLGAKKEIQEKELRWLAGAGYTAVTTDAPHHGERRSAFLDEIDRESNPEKRHGMVIDLVTRAAAEIPVLITSFRNEGFERIAVSGISLGGYTAFGSVLHQPLPDLLAPLLASPDWGCDASPHHHLDAFAKLPTLAVVAGKDTVVPPGPCRALFAALSKKYKKKAAHLCLQEYPESGHFMREEDWNDAWQRFIAFLDRHL